MDLGCRAMDQQIMTIKEAAWLTDQTYTYAEVVRMMGEIMAILGGHVRVSTCLAIVLIGDKVVFLAFFSGEKKK